MPVYEVPLVPVRGDGYLTAWDVELALTDLPRGCEIVVRVDECDGFDPSAPGLLARALSGSVVAHVFGANARRVARDWQAMYDRAAAEYLAVEARLLGA